MTLLRQTESLCPVCLRRIPARYESEGDTVLFRKDCPEHGPFAVPVWDTESFRGWSRPKTPSYPAEPRAATRQGCPFDCGLCADHAQHTCTGLIEVTERCDMRCPICYADAGRPQRRALAPSRSVQTAPAPPDPPEPSLDELAFRLERLYAASGDCNIQLSGGEPTTRDDLPAIIRLARQRFGFVQLNSNGLRLGTEAGYARTLREAGLDSVYLQWDGVTEATFQTLRGRDCLHFKHAALKACTEAGLGVVLVATVVRGINDGELGGLLQLALSAGPTVRGLHMQPVASFGRFPWQLAEAPRLTLPELMTALERQGGGLVGATDFHPPGCEHSLCSFSALYRRTSNGLEKIGAAPCCPGGRAETAEEGARKAKAFVSGHWKPGSPTATDDAFGRFLAEAGASRFTLSAMAFQDAMNLDVERVRGCCIHVVAPDGRLVPFCLYNLTALGGQPLYRRP